MKFINKKRNVLKRANSGNLTAKYQLARNLLEENKRAHALEVINNIKSDIDNNPLRLQEVGLYNFRGVEELRLDFNSDLTVIIGENGAGKSTILDAISSILSWFKANLIKENRNGVSLRDVDINNAKYADYASITSILKVDESNFGILLTRTKPGKSISRKSALIEIKALSGIYRFLNTVRDDANLPLIVHYSVARSNEGNRDDFAKVSPKNINENRWNKLDAYDDVLSDRYDFNEFLSWLIRIDNISRADNESKSILDSLLAEIASTEELIKVFESQNDNDNHRFVRTLREIIADKNQQLKEVMRRRVDGVGSQENRIIHYIKLAIKKFLPEIKDISLKYTLNDIQLILNKGEEDISAQQLSQGEKSLLSLIGDLTRRLVMLNPSRDNPLYGDGIVLIDEIDLHLHPAWQQTVILNLQSTFPNLQFILTTHSPQVLSTVNSDSIRILKNRNQYFKGEVSKRERVTEDEWDIKVTDQKVHAETSNFQIKGEGGWGIEVAEPKIYVETPDFQTKGVMSADILSRIMGIDPTPVTDEAGWVTKYLSYIENDEVEANEAKELWSKITSHFGELHPVVLECNSALRLKEMKKKINSKKNKG